MKGVVTAILGGGAGTRLWPLTRDRAKPAVPIGGKFRLIDIPISNSLHAGINRIYVMTQFNSASLHRHIAHTYRFDAFSTGFVNILAAEQNLENRGWYQGTADAVRQNMHRLPESDPSEILILSGDQLYLMDLQKFVKIHRQREADLTIAVKPVPAHQASEFGIMRVDADGRIVQFVEKPQDPAVINSLALDEAALAALKLDAEPGTVLASMGIYTFRTEVLKDLLNGTEAADFGKEVIPGAIGSYNVFAFVHDGYWEDIGTIPSFHQANIDLTAPLPLLNLYSPQFAIYTHPRFLPGCKVNQCEISQAILCGGTIISSSRISQSIIGVRARVQEQAVIEQSVIMGATKYEQAKPSRTPLGVGRDCHISRAIIDLDTRIGDGSRLINADGVQQADAENYCIRDGIIVVPRGAEIPPGTVI